LVVIDHLATRIGKVLRMSENSRIQIGALQAALYAVLYDIECVDCRALAAEHIIQYMPQVVREAMEAAARKSPDSGAKHTH
jgi:hypothetical protein